MTSVDAHKAANLIMKHRRRFVYCETLHSPFVLHNISTETMIREKDGKRGKGGCAQLIQKITRRTL